MKILLLGGTGAIGEHVKDILSKRDDIREIHITTRSKRQSTSPKVNYLEGNAHDIHFIDAILSNNRYDAIIDFMSYNTEEFKTLAFLHLKATCQYIFLSSSRVYADSSSPLTELSPRLLDTIQDHEYLDSDEYALTKARQEDILKNSGLNNWTIVRPYITYSEDRLQLGVLEKENWLYRALRKRTVIFSKDIAKKTTTLTYGYDVAYMISFITGNQKCLGETFHLTGNDKIRWGQVLDIYLNALEKTLGLRPKVILTEMALEKNLPRYKYQIKYDRYYDREFNTDKIKKLLGNYHTTDVETGLTNCLISFLNNPTFKNINWREEAARDKVAREFPTFREFNHLKDFERYFFKRIL